MLKPFLRKKQISEGHVMWLCAQVWGIGFEDRAVYFRQGVTVSELSGKAWKVVSVPRDSDRSHSSASASSLQRLVCFSL